MFARTVFLSILGLAALTTALPQPTASNVSPAAILVCELPTGDCSPIGNCEFCCFGDPGTDHCHTHGTTVCGTNDGGIVYHCDDDH